MRQEFQDKRKNTMKCLSAIGGKASMSVETEEERADELGIDALETVLANQFTQHQQTGLRFLVQFGLDYCAAIGQSCFNNDFRQAHKNNVSGRKSTQSKKKKKATGVNTVGAFHLLSSNAQKCLIRFAKEQTKEQ